MDKLKAPIRHLQNALESILQIKLIGEKTNKRATSDLIIHERSRGVNPSLEIVIKIRSKSAICGSEPLQIHVFQSKTLSMLNCLVTLATCQLSVNVLHFKCPSTRIILAHQREVSLVCIARHHVVHNTPCFIHAARQYKMSYKNTSICNPVSIKTNVSALTIHFIYRTRSILKIVGSTGEHRRKLW